MASGRRTFFGRTAALRFGMRNRLLSGIMLLAVSLFAASRPTEAQQFTWVGVDNLYNVSGNWSPGTGPPTIAGTSATFANTGVTGVNVDTAISPDSWTFNANSQSYTLTGANVNFSLATVAGGIINNANAGQTISIANNIGEAVAGVGLQQVGSSTLKLSGTNTYTGVTAISAGTLALTGTGSIAASSLVNFNAAGTFDISGTSAGATIKALAGGGGGIVNLGAQTLTMSNGFGANFAGSIQGSGGLTLAGGLHILSGTNTYTGATTISGGTLALTFIGSIATSSQVNLSNAAGIFDISGTTAGATIATLAGVTGSTVELGAKALTVSNGSTTFAGTIQGTGAFQVSGGIQTLSGTNTYSGATTVNAGTLVVNGSTAASLFTTVNGTLAGTGTVGATAVANGGTFAPGNGTAGSSMTVAGSLAFQSGALYLVQVNPTIASFANATSASLAGGTVNAQFAPGSYVPRNYTILHTTTANGLGGSTFGGLTTANLPAGFAASLSYSNNQDVILNLTATLGALMPGGLSQNQQAVASALNNFFNNGGALPPNFLTVFGLTGGNLANALTLLSGEAATGAQQGAFQLMSQFLGLMLDPFVDGRGGVGGGGPAMGFAPERAAMPEEIALAYASVMKAPVYKATPFEQRWTVWGAAYGGYNKTSGDPLVVGSHDLIARAGGFAAGMDYRVAPGTTLGFALAGGGTNWTLAQGLGGGKSDAFQAGVYGTTRSGPVYLAAAFAYTNHWMSTDRFAFAGDHLTASFNAQSIGARAETGYRIATPAGGITPYAAVQAQSFRTPNYSETDVNGGGFGLSYNARSATDTRSELGARFDHVAAVDPQAVLTLRARLAWAHDWITDPALAAVFQALPGASFIVNGATPAKDSALVSAGSELRLANGVMLSGKFDGELARHSETYAGTGTLRVSW